MKCASQRRRTLLPFLLAVPVACSEVAVTAVDVARVEIEPAAPSVIAGQTVALHATLRDGLGNALPGRSVAWSTSDPAIVGVDAEGVVVGRAVGTARVIAVAGGQQGESTVTVLAKPVAVVVIEPSALRLVVDESASLSAQPRAVDGEVLADRAVDWRTENPAVATVDNVGTVRAAGPGTTRILAVAEGVMGTSTVNVGPKPVASVQLAPAQLDLLQGEASTLSAVLRATDGTILTGRPVSWRSEDAAVAQVDGSGVVTAVGAGGTRIIAAAEGVEGAASVNVSLRPVAAVSVSPASATLNVGGAIQFHALLTAADGSVLPGRPVLWSSDASGVAHIEATGRVTAVGVGTATITATAEGVSGSATLVVQLVPVATVAVMPATLDLKPGDTGKLTAETRAADGTLLSGRAVTWASSDVAIATVDPNGNVAGVAAGTATITATSEGQSGTAAVSVKTTLQPVATVTVSPATVTLKTGDVQQFTATLTAADGTPLTGRAVTWTSSDVAVLLIDAQGRSAALAPGTATVTATSEGVSGTAAVTVTAPPPPPAPVATVTVSPTGVRLLPGGTQQFAATARAGDGTVITGRPVTWAAGSTGILTVDGQGLATAVAPGQTTVSATVDGVTGQVSVTVDPPTAPVATVTVTPTGVRLVPGGTQQFTATARAGNGTVITGRPVTWAAGSTSILTVDGQGLATAVAQGQTTVVATVDGVTGQVSVTVDPPPPPQAATVTVTPGFTLARRGTDVQLQAEVRASDGTLLQKTVTWDSSDSSIANVTSNGLVKTKKTGTVTITATVDGKSGSAVVVILP